MKIYHNFDKLSGRFSACIGFFDGVHLGHRFLLSHLCASSRAAGTLSAVVTFSNHPRRLVQPDFPLRLIDTEAERMAKLATTGVDACFVLDFTQAVRQMTAQQFLSDVLARQMHVVRLLIGYDHRFGHNRSEGFDDYVRYGRACGIEVVQQPVFEGFPVSSSLVRQRLAEGDVAEASRLLGSRYQIEGTVVRGHQLGRRLGFPTANIVPDCADKVLPARGVYAAVARLEDGLSFPAMFNIGCRPTVDGEGASHQITLEAHLIGFEGNLYDHKLRIELVERIRDERRMASLDELRAQLQDDQSKSSSIVAANVVMSR